MIMVLFSKLPRLDRHPAVSRTIMLVFPSSGCRQTGAQKAPLMTIPTRGLHLRMVVVIVRTLTLPTAGPEGALS